MGAPFPDDAQVAALCAQFDALTHQTLELFNGPGRLPEGEARNAALARIEEAQKPLLQAICCTPSASATGVAAKARSLALLAPHWTGAVAGFAGAALDGRGR